MTWNKSGESSAREPVPGESARPIDAAWEIAYPWTENGAQAKELATEIRAYAQSQSAEVQRLTQELESAKRELHSAHRLWEKDHDELTRMRSEHSRLLARVVEAENSRRKVEAALAELQETTATPGQCTTEE